MGVLPNCAASGTRSLSKHQALGGTQTSVPPDSKCKKHTCAKNTVTRQASHLCAAPSRRMAPHGAAPQALDTGAAETDDLAPALQSPPGGRRSRTSVDLGAEARALLSERFGGFLAAQAGVTVGLVRRAAARAPRRLRFAGGKRCVWLVAGLPRGPRRTPAAQATGFDAPRPQWAVPGGLVWQHLLRLR